MIAEKTKYIELENVLDLALHQASEGKGKARHAEGQPYDEQPIMWIEKYFPSYQLGQSVKKIHESQRLPKEMAINELLGAINYIAAKVIYLQKFDKPTEESFYIPIEKHD